MRKYFGTDGIRGVANQDPMTVDIALKVGRAAANVLKSNSRKPKIVIGKDTRLSCYMLEYALSAGICSAGVDTLLVGPLPTPGIAFLTASMRADAGVVISASHNPFQDNGIKFFDRNGFKLPDSVELAIERLMESDKLNENLPTANDVGRSFRIEDAIGRYIVFLKNSFPKMMTLDSLRIVLDCANGAAYKVAPTVLRELGAEVIVLGCEPNGTNINHQCGALYPELMCKTIKETQANVGIALDGDADRIIMADENGVVIDGDHLMAAVAKDLRKRDQLAQNTLVATIMSNKGLEIAMAQIGVKVARTQVGDRYVIETILEGGYNFGGEQSGHLIFLDQHTTGDGMLSALQILSIMVREQLPLSKLASVMESLPQVLVNLKVREKVDLCRLPNVKNVVARIESELGENGRVLFRYSGTENKARIMVEGPDHELITKYANLIAEALSNEIGL